MVKQYDDGYFINGEWYSGQYNVIDEVSNYVKTEIIDPMNKDNDDFIKCMREQNVYLSNNAWSTGDYTSIEEPYDVQYITYIFYAIAFLVVLAILFIIFA